MFIVAVLVGAFVLLAIYEVWQAQHGRPTISEQVWAFSKRWPPIGFLVGIGLGILLGHLFTV
jgi:hypothetical protein